MNFGGKCVSSPIICRQKLEVRTQPDEDLAAELEVLHLRNKKRVPCFLDTQNSYQTVALLRPVETAAIHFTLDFDFLDLYITQFLF